MRFFHFFLGVALGLGLLSGWPILFLAAAHEGPQFLAGQVQVSIQAVPGTAQPAGGLLGG